MATAKRKTKAPERVKLTARPVFDAHRNITNWEVTNGTAALAFKSETAALKSLNASIKRNVRRYIVVAEHLGADGKLKACREYTRKGSEIIHTDLSPTPKAKPPAATKPKPTPSSAKTAKAKAPKAKTAKKGISPGLRKYNTWAKSYRASNPGATPKQVSAAWAAHNGKPKASTAKKATPAKKAATRKAPAKKAPAKKAPAKKTPGTRLAPLPKAKASTAKASTAKSKGKSTKAKRTPKAGSWPAFVKEFAKTYNGPPKDLMRAASAARNK